MYKTILNNCRLAQVGGALYKTTPAAAAEIVAATPEIRRASDLPADLERWHYISESKLWANTPLSSFRI